MNIKPIKNRNDYRKALKRVEMIFDATPDTKEGDELDILTTLIEAYEAHHFPISDPDPIEAILHRMEALEMSRKDLESFIGSRSRVSEILSRKRALSLKMIRQLHKNLAIPAEVLINPIRRD